MIIPDSNVLSELTRSVPEPGVVDWLDAQPAAAFATAAVTAAELLHGVARLPAGKRKQALTEAVNALLYEDFRGRIALFDVAAAEEYARVVADRESSGRPVAVAQIAAIRRARLATLATRNVRDFGGTGVEVIDPWQRH